MFRNFVMFAFMAMVFFGISASNTFAHGDPEHGMCHVVYVHLYNTENPGFVVQQINDHEFQLVEYKNGKVSDMSGVYMQESGLKPIGAGSHFIVFVRPNNGEKFYVTAYMDEIDIKPLSSLKRPWYRVVSSRRANEGDPDVIIEE